MISGCGGCGSDDSAQKSNSKSSSVQNKTRKKADYEIGSLGVMPGSGAARHVKPGHWAAATHEVTANNFDAACDFHAEMRENGQPMVWPGTPYRLHTSQPAQLPKGKTRYLQTLFYVPAGIAAPDANDAGINLDGSPIVGNLRSVQLQTSLRQPGGAMIQQQAPTLTVMKPHEYQLIVLSPQAVGYFGWSKLRSLRPPNHEAERFSGDNPVDTHYHLVIPPITKNRPPPLSSHPLTWTSIAYVLWDELDPLALSAQQQQAMLDWLHWGGRLIVSGPGSLDLLRGSFLAPYLPATSARAIDIEASDLQPLNDLFRNIGDGGELRIAEPTPGDNVQMIPGSGDLLAAAGRLQGAKRWAGVKLTRRDGAEWVRGSGELLAERRVGRGRIVVSAFRLRERDLLTWKQFDLFLNTMLLRREPRTIVRYVYPKLNGEPAKKTEPDNQGISKEEDETEMFDVTWQDGQSRRDPRLISDLRYLSRDFGVGAPRDVAGWDDYGASSVAARASLIDAAGIEIPKASFIVWVMAVYLIVLVPINWGVFRLLGRVEWAWIAAPVITLVFTVAVVKLAQLDIGFARSQTEYCIVEAQGGYSRAHVTRYTALYASLSTSYDFEFDDDSALIGPFPFEKTKKENATRGAFQPSMTMTLRREDTVTAEGFNVSSNSTGMVHSEQMLDLGGAIRLDNATGVERIANGSKIPLEGVVIIRRGSSQSSPMRAAWIGDLAPGEDAPLAFSATTQKAAMYQQIREARTASSFDESSNLGLGRFLELAHKFRSLQPGESRLIAWSIEEVPGLQITPVASQVRRATLVVVHLRYALDPESPRLDEVKTKILNRDEFP